MMMALSSSSFCILAIFLQLSAIYTETSAAYVPSRVGDRYPIFMANSSDNENEKPKKNQNGRNEDIENRINKFLEEKIFDPNSESNQDNWFANLVKNDYDSAEALYVGALMIVGVIVSQELLRLVKYGDSYIPLGGYGGGGNLF